MMKSSKSHIILYVFMLLAMSAWGLSWSNAKILSEYAPAEILIFWRFLLSSISMLPVLFFFKQDVFISKIGLIYAGSAAIFISLYNLMFFMGTHLGSAGVGGVIVPTMNPIFTFIGSVIFVRLAMQKKDIVGLILGLIGGSVVLRIWDFSFEQITNSGNTYFLLASISWATLTHISSRSHSSVSTLTYSFWVYLISAVFYFPFALQQDWMNVFNMDWIFWVNMFFVSVGAMVFGTTVYFMGTTKLGSDKASVFIFTVPVSALVFSMVLLGEKLSTTTVVGGIFAMAAVYLINKKHPQKEPID